jgi:hypothetical protein
MVVLVDAGDLGKGREDDKKGTSGWPSGTEGIVLHVYAGSGLATPDRFR